MPRLACLILLLLTPATAFSQPRLEEFEGYSRYEQLQRQLRGLGRDGNVSGVIWSEDGNQLYYRHDGQSWRLNLEDASVEAVEDDAVPQRPDPVRPGSGRPHPGRAKQRAVEPSPDGKWRAVYRDHNVRLEHTEDAELNRDVTTDGNERFRFGTACWVYGEELDQNEAMWWSPDSRTLAFYEVDEHHMKDYFLTTGNTELYTELHSERYPKAGDPNPKMGLLLYDLETKQTIRVNTGGDPEWYVYDIAFTPAGDELLFHRTNRHQNVMQLMAADRETGESRMILEERQDTWQENSPYLRWLDDGQRFIWATERTGWKQFELRHLDGRRLNGLSQNEGFPADQVVEVDESAGWVYYTAAAPDRPLDVHLYRVQLDGSQHAQLTRRPLMHSSFNVAPDHEHFVTQYESVEAMPATSVYDMHGNELRQLASGDPEQLEALGLAPPELFTFKADDGETDLYGVLYKPSNFDPNKQYPLVISVYGGPSSRAIRNRFSAGNAYTEFGVLVAQIDNRGTVGRGKAFESANYQDLGGVDLKDQADGVRYLTERPYVDGERVGIYGHSYGGYMSALAVLKYPELFDVAVAGAPVTDWKNYDTIYTERYMRTPQENADGYSQGSCLTHADKLQGRLLLLHGLVDDNVHPSNTWQLIDSLQDKDKRFDLMVYPESAHGLIRSATELRWEYLLRHLLSGEVRDEG